MQAADGKYERGFATILLGNPEQCPLIMFGIHDFGLFLAAGILLNLTPGPDTVYILGRSIAQGREAGVASALGISLGSIFHTCAAALGLSAILATSALAFGTIKLIGGAYLIFLGIKMILDRRKQLSLPSNFRRHTTIAAFRQGVVTNILNPKVALFFLAFLPQFIDPASSAKVPAFILLGLTFVATGTIWCLILAWFASAFSERLRANETISQWLNCTAGALFVFLGLRLATTK
jgi:RhtB (resistance to homoserine/threonine) family protein